MNATVTFYKLARPNVATLEENVADASLIYARASLLQREAWEEFNEAVDTNQPSYVRDDLFKNATLAEDVQHEAYKMWDAAKAMLLTVWN